MRPGRDADPYSLLVPWSWKGRAIPLLPLWAVRPVQSLSACSRVNFTFFTMCTPWIRIGGIEVFVLNVGVRSRWMVHFTLRPLSPWERTRVTRAGLKSIDQTSQRHAPEHIFLHSHCRGNLKSSFERSVSTYSPHCVISHKTWIPPGLLYFQGYSATWEDHKIAKNIQPLVHILSYNKTKLAHILSTCRFKVDFNTIRPSILQSSSCSLSFGFSH